MIIIAAHAVYGSDRKPVHGTGSAIGTYLQEKKQPYFFIYHSLYGDAPTSVDEFLEKKLTYWSFHWRGLPFPIRLVQDQIISFYFIFKAPQKVKVFIGIDPFNALTGILAKKLGLAGKTVFYTADYAHQRLVNPFLNRLYHWFDRLAIKHADQVWNVSTRITGHREKQGVPKEKNFFIPNAPVLKEIQPLPYAKINQHDLVIVSHLTRAIDYSLLFQVIKKLSIKYKDIRLLVIGTGPDEKRLKNMVRQMKMRDRVLFLGQKFHQEVLKVLSQSAVGMALYTREQPWREFCDSLKIREYFACGLPVITTDVSSTADDVEKEEAGLVIDLNEKDLEKAIDRLFSDKKLYLKMRKNGIRLARKYDFYKVMGRVL